MYFMAIPFSHRFWAIVLLVGNLFLFACGSSDMSSDSAQQVTNAQNNQGQQGNLEGLQTHLFVESLCWKVSRCVEVIDAYQCSVQINAQTNIDSEVGVDPGVYANFSAVVSAEADGEIATNVAAGESCRLAIQNMSCDGIIAQSLETYGDYSMMFSVIPSACQGMVQ